MKDTSPVLVWLRLDLRMEDHPAFHAAAETGRPVVPVFIWAPEEEAPWEPGGASRWWLHHSLAALAADLKAAGSGLVIRRGPSLKALRELVCETGAAAVYGSRRYEPVLVERDQGIKDALKEEGIDARSFNSALLFEPWEISTQQSSPYKVFTPFWRACLAGPAPADPLPAPHSLRAPKKWPKSEPLDALGLIAKIPWYREMAGVWTPGERGALRRLDDFVEGGAIGRYKPERDWPGVEGTSRLSPHLHFGEISPRTIRQAVSRAHPGWELEKQRGAEATFMSEVGWREFAYHLLYHFPHTAEAPLRTEFERFPWREDPAALRAWQRGETGIGLVDAGMRQLWRTGWMHNRVRMVAASALTKNLLIPWQVGARWFWETLVDADLASNTLGWQWTAGCGADAAPYFRIFNPDSQAEKFDPTGAYRRAFAAPSSGPPPPLPIVDLKASRQRALDAYETIRKST